MNSMLSLDILKIYRKNETFPGIEGSAEIKRRVEEFRTKDIKEIEGRKVIKKVDYKMILMDYHHPM